jgi:hypothetical protein
MRQPRQSIAKRAEEIITRMGLPLSMEIVWAEDAKERIKSEMKKSAEKEWQARVEMSTRLKYTYSAYTPLKTRRYLNETFRGRQLLMLLRLDDLPLAAASWVGLTSRPKLCWCGQGDETREHFLLACPELHDIRESHSDKIPALKAGEDDESAMRYLLLGSDPSAADNVERAKTVGAYLADVWYTRGRRSGRHQEAIFP